MLIDVGSTPKYGINASSPNGYLLERIVCTEGKQFQRQAVEGAEIRYVEFGYREFLALI